MSQKVDPQLPVGKAEAQDISNSGLRQASRGGPRNASCQAPNGWSLAAVDGDMTAYIQEDRRRRKSERRARAAVCPGEPLVGCFDEDVRDRAIFRAVVAAQAARRKERRVLVYRDHDAPHAPVRLGSAAAPEQTARAIALLGKQLKRQAESGRIPHRLAPLATLVIMAAEDISTALYQACQLLESDRSHQGPAMGTARDIVQGVWQFDPAGDRKRRTSLPAHPLLVDDRRRLRAARLDSLHRHTARLQKDYTRALEGLRLVHDDPRAERAWLLAEHLEDVAQVIPKAFSRSNEPSAEDRTAWNALTNEERVRQIKSAEASATSRTKKKRAARSLANDRLARAVFLRDGAVNGFEHVEPTEVEVRAGLERAEELARSGPWQTILANMSSPALRKWLLKLRHGRSRQIGAGYQGGRKGRGEQCSARELAKLTLEVFPKWANSCVSASNRMGEARRAREAHFAVKLVRSSRPSSRKLKEC